LTKAMSKALQVGKSTPRTKKSAAVGQEQTKGREKTEKAAAKGETATKKRPAGRLLTSSGQNVKNQGVAKKEGKKMLCVW